MVDERSQTRTFVNSSLIFAQNFPSSRYSLITMFNALFFCFLPLESDLKSFENEVPIPKDASNSNDHHTET